MTADSDLLGLAEGMSAETLAVLREQVSDVLVDVRPVLAELRRGHVSGAVVHLDVLERSLTARLGLITNAMSSNDVAVQHD